MRTRTKATAWPIALFLLAALVPGARAACTYATSPASRLHGFGAATNTVTVNAGPACPWTVSNTNTWITILAGASGVSTGSVTYAVAPNPSPLERTGLVVIAGNTFTLRQSALSCSFSISPSTRTHGSGLVSNSIILTANGSGCPWSVSSGVPWITLVSPGTGLGSATVDYQVAPNPGLEWRTGTVMVAGQTFTLIQRGVTCSYELTPASRNHGYGSASNSFNVATLSGCAWTAVSGAPWISIVSGASGSASGDVGYVLSPNPTGASRTGLVSVAGQVFSLVQAGQPCTYAVLAANTTHGAGSETGSVMVSATAGCVWVVENPVNWVSILSGASGTGDGMVVYAVSANPGPGPRSAQLTIAGQPFAIYQDEPFCTYKLSPTNRVHGPAATTNSLAIVAAPGCAWTLVSTSSWVRCLASTGSGSTNIDYVVDANPGFTDRVTTLSAGGQMLTLRQLGISCVPVLSPTTRSHGYGGASNGFSLTVNGGCNWSAAASVPWISIVSGTNGSGNGSVGYMVEPNPSGLARTGAVLVADAVFNILQSAAPCGYAITPSMRNHGYGAASNAIVVTATPDCAWSVANTNAWLTVVAGATGAGDGIVGYLVAANTSTVPRSGYLVVGGQPFAISQAGAACSPAIEPTERAHGFNLETGLVRVTTASGCPWTVVNTNAWVAIIAGAQGGTESGLVEYVLATNPGNTPRFGYLTIAGQAYAVSQGATSCSYRLSPSSRTHGYSAASNFVTLTVSNGCTWSVVNTSAWISVVSPLSGNGSAILSYTLAANSGTAPRVGGITVGGQTLVITQQAVACTITLSPVSRLHGSGAASNSIAITDSQGCGWTVVNTNAWLNFPVSSGTGSVSVAYTIAANPLPTERSGIVLIGGAAFSIQQQAATCTIALSPLSRMHGSGATSNSVAVSDAQGCGWTVVNTNAWLTFPVASGTGSVSVAYTIAANPLPAERSGTVLIGGSAFSIQQQGVGCAIALSPVSRMHGSGATSNSIAVSDAQGCGWTVVNTNAWLTFPVASGTGSVSVAYTIAANPLPTERSGIVLIGGSAFSIQQQGVGCAIALSPVSRMHGSGATSNSIAVSDPQGCGWTVVNTNTWLTFQVASGTGNVSVAYTVAANPLLTERSGVVLIGGAAFSIQQQGMSCSWSLSPGGRIHGNGAATNLISITSSAGCAWSVVKTSAWVTVLSGGSGDGSGTVTYAVEANPSPDSRSTVLVIGDQSFNLTQAGSACSYRISPGSRTHGFLAVTNFFTVNVGANCPWSVVNTNPWVTLLSAGSGIGSNIVTYAVAPNLTTNFRSGALSIGEAVLNLTQRGATNGFVFEVYTIQDGSQMRLRLTGVPTGVWELQRSTDLRSWSRLGDVTNNAGVVDYLDPAPTNLERRFYRAVLR